MKIKLRLDEVLRYSGVKCKADELDDELLNRYSKIIYFAESFLAIRYCKKDYNITPLKDGLQVEKTNLFLIGNDIKTHLKNCDKCVLFAATLGVNADRKLVEMSIKNMTDNIIFNACCTEFLEVACDGICHDLTLKYGRLTDRFSPGYGDLNINIQREFVKTLSADKFIGLTVNQSNMLIPTKSITAFIGILKENVEFKTNKSKCNLCNKQCEFRKTGVPCGES